MKDKIGIHRVVTFLTREELEFLDKISKDMLFSTGRTVSRSKLIEDLVDILSKTRMNAQGIKDNQELQLKITEAVSRLGGLQETAKKEG